MGTTAYPGAVDNFATTSPTNLADDDSTGRTHSERHDDMESAMEAVQALTALAVCGSVAIIQSECVYPSGITGTNSDAGDWDGLTSNLGGTGATVASATESGHPGIVSCSTGTTTTGRCGLSSIPNLIYLGVGVTKFESVIKLPALSDGTQTFSAFLGLGNAMGSTTQTDGVGFRYSHSVNSGKWQYVTTSASSETAADTGITADTGWHRFGFEVNAGGSSVEFFIDGVSVGTQTATIPTAGVRLIACNIVKSAGSTARTIYVDMFRFTQLLTTAR